MPSMNQLLSDLETGPAHQTISYMPSGVHSEAHTSVASVSSKHAKAGSDELGESSESGGKLNP